MVLPKEIVPIGTYIHAIATMQAPRKLSLAAEGGILKSLHCLDLKLNKIETF